MPAAAAVDLVVNTFERSYRTVLSPGFFDRIAEQSRFAFTRRVALINNVIDIEDARTRARGLIAAGEIDAYREVAEELPRALDVAGLERGDLGRIPYYTDCSLVAVTMEGSAYVTYWDADVTLDRDHDWITPSLMLMQSDSRVMVANPAWYDDAPLERTVMSHTDDGQFALGWGFSDQIYLVRREMFRAPIYQQRCLASLRFPMSAVTPIFEARVDAYMRTHDLLRASYLPVRYHHPFQATGTATEQMSPSERLRYRRNQFALAFITHAPLKRRCWRYL